MGGIAGIFHPDIPKPVDPARIEAMTERLAHRGPDGSGIWTAPGIGLGHRRLSLGDRSEAGARPMLTADRRTALSFDGEIYNGRELRSDLESKGHAFRGEGDAEILLAAWRQWGRGCLARLDGIFAIALYDGDKDSLFLARDRLGVKPLFHVLLSDGALIFASELKALLAHPRLRRSVNPRAVEDYLALGFVPDDTGFVDGVAKLPAGHFLHLRRGRPVPAPTGWWELDFCRRERRPRRQLEDELAERLGAAIGSRVEGEGSAGVFLSGGVASSAIVAFMAETSREAVQTCSVRFAEAEDGESRFASLVAEHFIARHREIEVGADDLSMIDSLAEAFDEPFADPAALGALQLSALAAGQVKSVLTGDGAAETLSGQGRYRRFAAEERLRQLLPMPLRRAAASAGGAVPEWQGNAQAVRVRGSLQAMGMAPGEAFAASVAAMPPSVRSALCNDDFRRALQGYRVEDRYVRAFEQARAADPASSAQYVDLKINLPAAGLTRLDRTTMAVGLQARTPLLDHRLVEFAAGLPTWLRLRGGTDTWLMKRILKTRLPKEILHRPRGEQNVPVSAWFRGPLAERAVALSHGSALAELGWFNGSAIARLAEEHRRGSGDHGPLLWQLLMLETALQRLFGMGAVSPADRQPRQNRGRRAAR